MKKPIRIKRKKKDDTSDSIEAVIIYESPIVTISVDYFNDYSFDITHKNYGRIITNNYLEAISILIKIKEIKSTNDIWDIIVTDSMREGVGDNIHGVLYWLSGGNKEWKENDTYSDKYEKLYDILKDEFGMTIYDIMDSADTFLEVRKLFIKKLSLSHIYNFALKYNILHKNK